MIATVGAMSPPLSGLTPSTASVMRWRASRLRRRMLYGRWRSDAEERAKELVGSQRAGAWKHTDITGNVFKASAVALSALYDRPGTFIPPSDSEDNLDFLAAFEASGFWSLMPTAQRDTIGLQDLGLRVLINDDQTIALEVAWPDLLEGTAARSSPGQAASLFHARPREIDDKEVWTWDEIDVRRPDAPVWRVWDAGRQEVITEAAAPRTLAGFPFMYGDRPVMPVVMYHATAHPAALFDCMGNEEVVDGALNAAVYWSMWGHNVRQASWQQRYGWNVKPVGGTTSANGTSVVTDPATVALFETLNEEAGQGVLGQWEAPVDPKTLGEAVAMYERRVATLAGVSGSAVQRMSGDPRSGYAIALTHQERREHQRKFEPAFGPSDLLLLHTAAKLWATATGRAPDVEGWTVRYARIPKTPEEEAADLDRRERRLALGMTSLIEEIQRDYPELDEDSARKRLEHNLEINRRYAAAAP